MKTVERGALHIPWVKVRSREVWTWELKARECQENVEWAEILSVSAPGGAHMHPGLTPSTGLPCLPGQWLSGPLPWHCSQALGRRW